jgi:hypothetical protein
MPVSDQDFICPSLAGTTDSCIDVVCHQATKAGIFNVVGVNLIPVGHSSDAFHVGSNENFHYILSPVIISF